MEGKEKKDFIDGFNKGYLISKYESELGDSLSSSLEQQQDKDSLIEGFIEGHKEQRNERELDELRDLRSSHNKDLNK